MQAYNQAEKTLENHLGSYHHRLAHVYLLKAALFEEIGAYGESLKYFQKRHQLLETLYGTEDPRSCTAQSNMSSPVYQKSENVIADQAQYENGFENVNGQDVSL